MLASCPEVRILGTAVPETERVGSVELETDGGSRMGKGDGVLIACGLWIVPTGAPRS